MQSHFNKIINKAEEGQGPSSVSLRLEGKTFLGLVLSLAVLLAVMAYLPFPAGPVGAQSQPAPVVDDELRGWAWSGVTGWVSFNDKDWGGAGGVSSDYQVKINNQGQLSGYAWSLNLGWIKFDPSLYPSSCSRDCYGARLVNNDLKGWARVCSVYKNGCQGELRPNSELGGWDGWVEMHNIKRQPNGGFYGYAWGDLNLAWLDFGLRSGGDGDGGSPCNPQEQVCSGDVTDELEGDFEVTVLATAGGCVGGEVAFSGGQPCDPAAQYCRLYEAGSEVTVTFTGVIPESVTGCSNYTIEEGKGVCVVNSLSSHLSLSPFCGISDITQCRLSFEGGVPLILSESHYITYPTFSNSGIGRLRLSASGRPCVGITYNLESKAYKVVNGVKTEEKDLDVTIACQGVGGFKPENCLDLDGSKATLVKAYFKVRPTERAAKWSLEMVAKSADGQQSQQFGQTLNQLIQFLARTGS